ncbi:MAG TPA: hypothetical protein VME86_01810 [Acidobacteriaceae bacterium]|nr:hypothetical protein [Acidobacteriaceae bacterium]
MHTQADGDVEGPQPVSAERWLADLGIELPSAPTPLGSYVESAQIKSLLYRSGVLRVVAHKPLYVGRPGEELDMGKAVKRHASRH